jgi:hypothetical protein
MNQLTSRREITLTPALGTSLRNQFFRAALALLGLFIVVSTVTLPAKTAGCNRPGGRDSIVKYPTAEHDGATGPNTIMGLWHVAYTAGGASFGVALKECTAMARNLKMLIIRPSSKMFASAYGSRSVSGQSAFITPDGHSTTTGIPPASSPRTKPISSPQMVCPIAVTSISKFSTPTVTTFPARRQSAQSPRHELLSTDSRMICLVSRSRWHFRMVLSAAALSSPAQYAGGSPILLMIARYRSSECTKS